MDVADNLTSPYERVEHDGVLPLLNATFQVTPLDQDSACSLLKHSIDALESSLKNQEQPVDIEQLHTLLGAISLFLGSKNHQILAEGFTQLLNRLVKIYTQGLIERENPAFSATATHYAKLIEITSQAFPGYDYTRAIGHLLHYMNHLYSHREGSWLDILRHLLSMPDSIQLIQLLKEKHLYDIQQWVEEGVNNLFQLHEEQMRLSTERISKLKELEESIEQKESLLQSYQSGNVLSFSLARDRKALRALNVEKAKLIEEIDSHQHLISLLDENIDEFGDKLFATRRAYLLHPL
ncbi:MAG: hypothetical protein OQK71_00945 [Desulfobacter sp.]|nr:hypothetical protein [Desulfobacter sp.]